MKKRILSLVLALVLIAASVGIFASCGKKKVSAKIGVIRGDASSEEAMAWEQYLKDLSDEMGVQISFSTAIESADQELTTLQDYASRGYNGIIAMTSYNTVNMINKCEEYGMYLVFAAAHPDFEDSETALSKDPSILITDYTNYPHYVGATGPSNYSEVEAGYQMGQAAVAKGYTKYSVFTGAAAYGQPMHALRVAGFFIALHDDDSTVTYNGIACTKDNWRTLTAAIQSDLGVNLSSFSSTKYSILAQAGGYSFLAGDTTAADSIKNLSAVNGVEAVFCAGSADSVSGFAPSGATCVYIGDDSLGSTFEGLFTSGKLVFDVAKYNSYVGPAFAMLLKSIYNDSAVRVNGKPVSIEQGSLQITAASDYTTINQVENKNGGYFFSSEFLSAYILETKLSDKPAGYEKITDEAFAAICSRPATLTSGGLYEATKAVTDAYKAANKDIFVFTTEKTDG
jgi:hypothetical protein